MVVTPGIGNAGCRVATPSDGRIQAPRRATSLIAGMMPATVASAITATPARIATGAARNVKKPDVKSSSRASPATMTIPAAIRPGIGFPILP